MKLRSREINIFSMSALDLFASAMGAFMLLSIMSMPFFPNTGDSPELVAEVAAQLEQARDELAAAQDELAAAQDEIASTQDQLEEAADRIVVLEQENSGLTDELSRISVPDLDIVIALDISASMGEQIEQLKGQIVDLASVLNQLSPSVGIGVVAFGDRFYDQPITAQDILPTTNLPAIENFVATLRTELGLGNGYNDDTPEALGAALNRAVALSWRPVSQRRYIIVVTDATAYPEEMASTFDLARRFNAATGVQQVVSTVFILDPDNTREAELYLQELAQNGGGEFVDSTSGQSILASILMAVVSVQI